MNPAGIFDTFMFDFRLEEYMEVSLAALMGNLLTCSTERASWRLCYSIFLYLSTWQMSRSFCSTRTSQECEHTIFRHHEALQRSMLSLLSRGSLRTWLHWRFCDRYSHFHPGRMSNMQLISEIALPKPESTQLCDEVATTAGQSHRAFCPLSQTLLSGPHVHRFQGVGL